LLIIAAPVSEPGALNKFPVLFAKDPLSIHKRAANRNPEPRVAAADVAANPELDEVTEVATQDEDSCAEVCGIRKVEGAKTEREALCSIDGLRATRELPRYNLVGICLPEILSSRVRSVHRLDLARHDVRGLGGGRVRADR
jgi:hypothetical protein